MYDNIEDKKSREEYTMLSKYRIKELRNILKSISEKENRYRRRFCNYSDIF